MEWSGDPILSIDFSFIGESKIEPNEVLLSLRLDLEVGDKASSDGMSVVDLFLLGSTHWLIGMPKTAPSPVLFLFSFSFSVLLPMFPAESTFFFNKFALLLVFDISVLSQMSFGIRTIVPRSKFARQLCDCF